MQWLIDHAPIVLSICLGVSESLALAFPPATGFGGILAGIIKFVKMLGGKEPGQA